MRRGKVVIMKIFLILLFSFSANAGHYIKRIDFDAIILNCNHSGYDTFRLEKDCGADCVKLTKKYNCNYSELQDEMIDNYDAPNWGTRSLMTVLKAGAVPWFSKLIV